MDFTDYQAAATQTAIYNDPIIYPALGLGNEAGETLGKVKKLLRDGYSQGWQEQIGAEIGDCLWYCAALAHDLGLDLGEIAANNIAKLKSRQERNVLGGSGDNR